MKLPLHLAHSGASTIEDADGVIVAECIDPETAAAIVEMIAALRHIADGNISPAITFARLAIGGMNIREAHERARRD